MVKGVGAPAGVAGTEKNAEARPLIVCNCTAAVTPLTVTPASAAPSAAAGRITLSASDDGGTRSVNASRPLGRSNAGGSIVAPSRARV